MAALSIETEWRRRVALALKRHPIGKLIMVRITGGVLTILIVSVLIFAAVSFLPGNAATAVLGAHATAKAVARLQRELGLNVSPVTRYLRWLGGLVRGRLGVSLTSGVPVSQLLLPRLANTAILAAAAGVVTALISIPLGWYIGMHFGEWRGNVLSSGLLLCVALPDFVVGLLLAYGIGLYLKWLPPTALAVDNGGVIHHLKDLVLPAATLVIVNVGYTTRMVAANTAEVNRSSYVVMGELLGLRRSTIASKFVLRNALAPAVQAFSLTLEFMIAGVIVVENVFAYPGIGQLTLQVAQSSDYTTLEAVSIIIAGMYVAINLINDVVVLLLTPKRRTW